MYPFALSIHFYIVQPSVLEINIYRLGAVTMYIESTSIQKSQKRCPDNIICTTVVLYNYVIIVGATSVYLV